MLTLFVTVAAAEHQDLLDVQVAMRRVPTARIHLDQDRRVAGRP